MNRPLRLVPEALDAMLQRGSLQLYNTLKGLVPMLIESVR